MSRKIKLVLMVLLILAIVGYFLYGKLLPNGPVLDEVPNPVKDRALHSWEEKEDKIPTNEDKNVYFGDLHVHTSFSFDAYIGGTRSTPDGAYRFAKGETIDIYDRPARLQRALDFAAVTDHSEYFGEMYAVQMKRSPAYHALMSRHFRGIGLDTIKQRSLFQTLLENIGKQEPSHLPIFQGYQYSSQIWDEHIEAAERHYQPGTFTTLMGYEWTLGSGMAHVHRNVFFRDAKVPDYPISALEARNEEALWASLDDYRSKGAIVMAIPHNMNLSEGEAFPEKRIDGSDIDLEYIQTRNRNEPIAEMHQAKGNSEVHAALWKNDEFADFENYHQGPPRKNDFMRYILKKGLEYDAQFGTNPYQYGFIGSTDTHNGVPGNTEEDDRFLGNHALVDSSAEIRASRQWVLDVMVPVGKAINPGGLAAVWAKKNTRAEIYDALVRRETYATSGGRMQVRFFGGFDLEGNPENYDDFVTKGYASGVPMGANLRSINGEGKKNQKPTFNVWAAKDPDGANLDRIQIIKGWYENGELKEDIFNVALSDNRQMEVDGSASSLEATVNMETGEWDRTKGAAVLFARWTDTDFDEKLHAFYYVRALEVTTARYSLLDEIRFGVRYPDGIDKVIQERAWSSPIWYKPISK